MNKILSLITFIIILSFSLKAQDGWEITTHSKSDYVPTCVANGQIGIVPDAELFETQKVILNHVFDRQNKNDISRVLTGINPFNLKVSVNNQLLKLDNVSNWQQTLDMKKAALQSTFNFQDKVKVSYSIQELRNMPFGGLIQVQIEATKKVTLDISNIIKTPEQYKNVQSRFRILKDLDVRMPVFQTIADSPFEAHQLASASGFIFDNSLPEFRENIEDPYQSALSFTKTLNKGESFSFSLMGSVCNSLDFNDPIGESERFVVYAQQTGVANLLQGHQNKWNELWESDIIIEGDKESQLDVRFALYNLYSFQRDDNDLSISPMGLSSQGYNGHVFWDAEIWMYPPLLVLHPEMGKTMMNYRINRLPEAIDRAKNYGFQGAMFPWESDYSGEEATPTWCLTGVMEQHITADIGIAAWNYYCVTKDKEWLREKGWPVLKNAADFWFSRATLNKDGSYSINNVVGANEWAHVVNNNAFTNGSVKKVMEYAINAAQLLDNDIPDEWRDLRDQIKIEQFSDGTTKEHADYNGEIIKQADVNLLAYPLQIVTDQKNILKDLEYYEPKLSAEGPAMSYSIFSILYARLGKPGKAFELFKKAYIPNKRAPFGVLAESATSNNPYFATGAGGMLQAVIFGFAGLEITPNGIIRNTPCLPKKWKSLTIKGIGVDKEKLVVK
ncbi:glycosyl hydrolase family 95 catalytic domain-containing protein [Plebeiibacterium sediminum]|uniref:Glycoside hydrolase family 65 protein n=1 Tax=Plebeiibacterium sediminum TaxID=2992112 RepID=A0AAE3SGV9_9BACT|nr:hypothetical protein [Plebeiobacterium sediminum]MCW3788893.1 hypothetical protein [Plebeiobacterium sediminum]